MYNICNVWSPSSNVTSSHVSVAVLPPTAQPQSHLAAGGKSTRVAAALRSHSRRLRAAAAVAERRPRLLDTLVAKGLRSRPVALAARLAPQLALRSSSPAKKGGRQ